MASRGGPRVEGTDGSDFRHRQTVAARYQTCVALKSAVRKINSLHVLVWLLLAAQLTVAWLSPVSSHHHADDVPPTDDWFWWKHLYLLSAVPTALSFAALPRSNAKRLVVSMISAGLFGVAPLLYGIMEMFPVALWLYRHDQALGFSTRWLVTCLVLAMAVPLHAWQLYYSKKLLDQWFTGTQDKNK